MLPRHGRLPTGGFVFVKRLRAKSTATGDLNLSNRETTELLEEATLSLSEPTVTVSPPDTELVGISLPVAIFFPQKVNYARISTVYARIMLTP